MPLLRVVVHATSLGERRSSASTQTEVPQPPKAKYEEMLFLVVSSICAAQSFLITDLKAAHGGLTHGVGSPTAILPSALPERIDRMLIRLRRIDGPIRYSAIDSKRDILLAGEPATESRVLAGFQSMLASVREGTPPHFDDVLSTYDRWSSLPRVDPGAERQVRIFVEYERSGERESSVLRFEDGRFQSELVTESVEMGYQSSVGRVRIAPARTVPYGHFLRPSTLLYPLSTDPGVREWFKQQSWSRVNGDSGHTTLFATRPGEELPFFVACFDRHSSMPIAAILSTQVGPEKTDVAYSAAFYRHPLGHRQDDFPLSACEVIQFDTLAVKGVLALRRIIPLAVRTGDQVPMSEMRLPVDYSHPRLLLKDLRDPASRKDYGADVTSWPSDVLEMTRSIDGTD